MTRNTLVEKYNSEVSQEYLRDKIEGKKILVMGSGPSVDLRNWSNLNFDYMATVSFWYNRPDLLQRNDIFLTAYSDLVDLSNPNLASYLNTHNTLVGFEEANPPFYKSLDFKNFKDKYKSRYIDFKVKFRNEEKYMGLAGRILYFVLNFNPSTLYYIGLDGVSNNPEQDPSNSFRMGYRPETTPKGSGASSYSNIRTSHLYMASTLHSQAKARGTTLYNLGEGLPFNISGEYSKTHYPLSKEIIDLLKM